MNPNYDFRARAQSFGRFSQCRTPAYTRKPNSGLRRNLWPQIGTKSVTLSVGTLIVLPSVSLTDYLLPGCKQNAFEVRCVALYLR